ncbi:MAG: hypothetical protein JO033_02385 [Acidobacteriaceae bacterium]|nr:hypothetical protein [Acidobacteriaceae bacterium]MBV9499704.1 hypothetical protein [Acidobacteriaceae bacterium]
MSASPVTPAPPPPIKPSGFAKWHRRVLAICLIVFTFEVGLFLVVFPWLRSWELSWIPTHSPHLAGIWLSPYFRGALSGLGLLNLYVAVAEAVRQLKWMFGQRS